MSVSRSLNVQSILQASQAVVQSMPPVDVAGLNPQLAAQVQAIIHAERFHSQNAVQMQFALVHDKVRNVSQQVDAVDRKIGVYATSASKEIAENKAALQALQQAQADMKSSVDKYLTQAREVPSVPLVSSAPPSMTVSILSKPENRVLRGIFALVLRFGLDTTCASGLTPVIQFDYLKSVYPNTPATDPNEVVALLPRCTGEAMKLLGHHFVKPIQGPIAALERRRFNLDTLEPLAVSRDKLSAIRFPFHYYVNGNMTVMRLSTLIEFLQVELAAATHGLPPMLNDEPFKPNTFQFRLSSSDQHAILVSNNQVVKCRKVFSFDPQCLRQQLEMVRNQPFQTVEAKWQFTTRRRFATLEASSEHLEHPPTRLAVQTILKQVFRRTDPLPEGPFHMGLHWQVLPDRPVHSFSALLAEVFQVQSPAILEAFRQAKSLPFPPRFTHHGSVRQTRQRGSVKRSSSSGSSSSSSSSDSSDSLEWLPLKKQKKRTD